MIIYILPAPLADHQHLARSTFDVDVADGGTFPVATIRPNTNSNGSDILATLARRD